MLTDLKAKYLNLPPSAPWPSVTGTRFLGANMADLDNDGRDEVIALSPGPFADALGVLAYFNYAEMAPSWGKMLPEVLMVGATVVAGNQTNWTAAATDQIWKASIKNAEGVDLLIFDGNQTLSLVRWEQAAVNSNPIAFVLNKYWSAAGTITAAAGQQDWTLASGDRFYVGDIDGDGIAEIIVFDGNANFALLKWTGSAVQLIWMNSNGVIAGAENQPSWSLAASDRFYVGDIDGDGLAEIIAFDGTGTLALTKWEASNIQLYWVTNATIYSITGGSNWNLGSDDWFHLADINGDGKKELVVVGSTALGVTWWNGSDLRVMGINSGTVSGSGGEWTISVGDVHYLANFEQSGQAGILAFNAGQLALLRWDGAENCFVMDFIGNGSLSGPGGASWNLSADNLFTCADVDGDGIAEVIVQSDGSQALALLKWDHSQLAPLWVYTATNSALAPLPTWGVNLISGAPATPFSPFTGTQKEIYIKTSQAACGSGVNDIRGEYTNTTQDTSFSAWRGTIVDAAPNEQAWEWMSNYDPADINAVFTQLEGELAGVASSYGLTSNLNCFFSKICNQRQTDLTTVVQNLTVVIPPESPVDYWVGQIFEAALWGIAAVSVEGYPAISITNAIIASLAGSFLGAANASDPSSTIQYQELSDNIKAEYVAATTATNAQLQAVVQDPVKLLMLGQLLITKWQWTPTTTDVIVAASSNFTRLNFYQQLVPQLFVVWQRLETMEESIDMDPAPPSWATWSFVTEMRFNNLYALAWNSTEVAYASQALVSDLFTSLGLDLQSFLAGQGSIPLSTLQLPPEWPGTATIFTTNSTSSPVWVTIYDVGKTHGLDWGWVYPGSTRLWRSGNYLWGSYYHVRGQVNGDLAVEGVALSEPRPTPPQVNIGDPQKKHDPNDTSVEINPQYHEESPNGYSGYAVNIVQGSTNYYWEHVN